MAINRGYDPNHKFYDRMGRITPNVEWSESIRPHIEKQVASWLPVIRFDKSAEEWKVASTGKPMSVDREGHIVPSGFRVAFAPGAATALSYTANDVSAGVTDLTTGSAVASVTSYSEAQVTTALRNRGLIRSDERAMDFISHHIGISPYDYFQAAGSDVSNPSTFRHHNFKLQGTVAVLCDYAIAVPLLPAVETTETMDTDNMSGYDNALVTNGLGSGGWYSAAQLHAFPKFASLVAATDDIVGYVFEKFPVAKITEDTPITVSVDNALISEKSSIADIASAGDFFIDYDSGVLFLYEAGGDAIPSPFSISVTITYFQYEDAVASGSIDTSYLCATGNLREGDFLTYNASGNLIKAEWDMGTGQGYDATGSAFSVDPDFDTDTDANIAHQIETTLENFEHGIVGQVISEITFPRGFLGRVRTAFEGQSAANMQAPGSATGGRTDQLTYAGASNRLLIVNLIKR